MARKKNEESTDPESEQASTEESTGEELAADSAQPATEESPANSEADSEIAQEEQESLHEPVVPSLEEVIAAGYDREVAERIVERQQRLRADWDAAHPPAPVTVTLQRHHLAVPEHEILKPHHCPTCRTQMSLYGNVGKCHTCGVQRAIA